MARPLSPSLCLTFVVHQPSKRHHAQSLQGPSFHVPRKPYVLESHPERAAPLPAAMVSNNVLSTPTTPLQCTSILQPVNPPHVDAFQYLTISAPICLNCVQS